MGRYNYDYLRAFVILIFVQIFSDLKHLMQTLRAIEELRQKTANEKGVSTRSRGSFRSSAHFEIWL